MRKEEYEKLMKKVIIILTTIGALFVFAFVLGLFISPITGVFLGFIAIAIQSTLVVYLLEWIGEKNKECQ